MMPVPAAPSAAHLAGTVPALRVVMQRAALAQRHADERAARRLRCLADRLRHLARLAVAEAYPALLIAHHHQRGKAEALAALDHLGHAVDVHELVFELAIALVAIAIAVPVSVRSCHVDAFLWASRGSSRLRARRRPAP
jgi:hypothetical protein